MLDLFNSSVFWSVMGLIVTVVALVAFVLSRYKVAGPNQALIVTGRKGKTSADLSTQRVVIGGGLFVVPVVQQSSILDLSSRRIDVLVKDAPAKNGIKLSIQGVAIVKVGSTDESIRAAAQRFNMQQGEIAAQTTEVLSGALRSIVGNLTVEDIIKDRMLFANQVSELTEQALTGQGLVLDTFQIQDVSDSGSYLTDLGRPEAARVQQQAAIAEAQARQAAEQARIATEQQILNATRELALQRAAVKAETDAAEANAAAAGPLAEADKRQQILNAQEKVAVQQAALTDRTLDTEVRKPADAARYQAEQEAEAERITATKRAEAAKFTTIAQAEAKAEQDRLTGEGEKLRRTALAEAEAIEGERRGAAERAQREAVAKAVEAEGAAQASATLAVGTSEAEAMTKKAEAYAQYNQAAVLELVVKALPAIAREIAAPMGAIDNLTVLSTEGAGALPKQVTTTFAQLQEMLKATTGVDLASLLPQNGTPTGTPPAAAPVTAATRSDAARE